MFGEVEFRRRFPVADGKILVTSVAYHRNGVAGDGFHEVRFQHEDGEHDGIEFIGVVAESSFLSEDDVHAGAHVYVAAAHEPGVTMRGHDYYGDALVAAVNAYRRKWRKENGWPGRSRSEDIKKGKI